MVLLLFSEKYDQTLAQNICSKLGFSKASNVDKYHGFPKNTNLRNTRNYQDILSDIGGQFNLLSRPGTETLIKSTLGSTFDSFDAMSQATHQNISKKNVHKSPFGELYSKRKLQLINWNIVVKCKNKGGLQIKSTKHQNSSLLAGLA